MSDFTLTNGVRRSERARAPKATETQRALFSGLDCLPGTQDLLPDLDVPEAEPAPAPAIGQIVRFSIPGINGPMMVAGTVKRLLPDGRIEVKTQNHGYHTISSPQDCA